MTTMPGVSYRPLHRSQGQSRMARHDLIVFHTMVGSLTSTDRYFRSAGWSGTESHFGVGGKWSDGRDGEIIQWQDTEYRADAQLEGNHRAISIETGDNAPRAAKDIEPWTDRQLDALVEITTWACRKYDIPAILVPDSRPGFRGIAYHRQGCRHSAGLGVPGFLVSGGEKWSTSVGKECPGPARIAQIPGIIRRVKAQLAGVTPAAPEKENTVAEINPAQKIKLSPKGKELLKADEAKLADLLQGWSPGIRAARNEVAALSKAFTLQMAGVTAQMNTMAKAVQALTAGLSAPELQKVFTEGIADMKAELHQELSDLDIRLVLDQDDTPEN